MAKSKLEKDQPDESCVNYEDNDGHLMTLLSKHKKGDPRQGAYT